MDPTHTRACYFVFRRCNRIEISKKSSSLISVKCKTFEDTCEKIPDGSFWCRVATRFHSYFVNNAARAGLNAKSEEIVRKKRGYNSLFCKAGDVDE